MTKETHPSPIIIGFTVDPIAELDQVITMPQPPKGYGDDAAEKWRNDPNKGLRMIKEAVFKSAFSKLTGRISGIYAVDVANGEIFDSKGLGKTDSTVIEFAKWLLGLWPTAFPKYAREGGVQRGVAFYGFHPKEFLRVLGVQCQLEGHSVPLGLWYQNEDCFDPFHMLVEADRRSVLPLGKMLSVLGLDVSPGWTQHKSPHEDARIAAELIHSFGLVPVEQTEGLTEIIEQIIEPVDEIAEPDPEPADEEDAEAAQETAEEAAAQEEETAETEDTEDDDEYEYEEVDEDDDEDGDEYEDAEEGEEAEADDADVEYEDEDEPEAPPAPVKRRRRQASKG